MRTFQRLAQILNLLGVTKAVKILPRLIKQKQLSFGDQDRLPC
jgi:hypothetical protein